MDLKKQNILFIVRTMGIGGTENVVLQLCEIFEKKVNKIIVCSSGGVHEEILRKMGIKHFTIPDIASKNPVYMIKTYLKLKSIIKKEQITVIHSHHRMAALYAELAAPKHVFKVANAHNTFYNKKKLTHFAYKNTKIIAVGEMVKKNIIDFFYIPVGQVCVINNAVKPFNEEIKEIECLKNEKAKGNVLIGNVGRLSEQKGMCYFIEAAQEVLKSHPKARFFLVGEGELKDQLYQQVALKGLQDKIIFLGYRSDVQNVVSQLDFVVLSSLWEGLPLTPIEAFSVGKTVIGTNVDGTPEIIRDGVDGYLVEPRNIGQLAKKINFLLENPEVRKKLEEQAAKRYRENFSFEKFSQKYVDFYKEL